MIRRPQLLLVTIMALLATHPLYSQEKKALTLTDLMKFRQVESPAISRDGNWVMHTARPDRGDPSVLVYSSDGKTKYEIDLGEKPMISHDGNWVAASEVVPAELLLKSTKAKDKENGPKPGMVLLNTATGQKEYFENIRHFSFSENSQWIAYLHTKKDAKKKTGTTLVLKSLSDTLGHSYAFVTGFAVDSLSKHVAFIVSDTSKKNNGVWMADLSTTGAEAWPVYQDTAAWFDYLSWNKVEGSLAFMSGEKEKKEQRKNAMLHIWTPGQEKSEVVLTDGDLENGWRIHYKNRLRWARDGERLLLALKPASEFLPFEEEKEDSLKELYSYEDILADRGVDVWHWEDPYISTHQKKMWDREKDKTYATLFFPGTSQVVRLADPEMPDIRWSESKNYLLGYSNVPYARKVTWDGRYLDYYLVNPNTGERKKVIDNQSGRVRLSPDGNFLAWFKDENWNLLNATSMEARNLTRGMPVSFADEDWDYPEEVNSYGVAGWINSSESVMIYDKFDIWTFPTKGGPAVCLTEGKGREGLYRFRIRNLDPDKKYFEDGEKVFLTAYHDSLKHTAIYRMETGPTGVKPIVEEEKLYTLVAKAKDADKLIFTRQSYTEFPDLWVTNTKFKKPLRLSDVNPQVENFAWGNAQLVEWQSADGKPLQGILITPDNYKEGDKLPVLVYYYRFFTDRMYRFNHVAVNHRPCFPYYASNGYAVFLPDIRFDIGNPGYSATKCLVPGVQKIIAMGVADPDAICLHGHSWSGYQTAQVITQTDIFACAIAGAPVSNMTSAYSGIRWESGMARQFQYEKTQSRIGGSLWEAREKYIENSPVFYADRISTPLLIQFGDVDGDVPWYQGIELYLAMRRLDKDCIFLQYRGEPHHLKQYANKLDYTIKFKDYLDHYLKGEPAADWITDGVPYIGK